MESNVNMGIVVTAIAIGVTAGWCASVYVRDGARGLGWDMVLGVIGGMLGLGIARFVGPGTDANAAQLVVAAAMGAAGGLGLQRKFWPGPAPIVQRVRR